MAKKEKINKFEFTLNISDKEYIGSADNVTDAIFKLEPEKICNKGLLTLTNGELKSEKLFYVEPLRRLFMGKVARAMMAKYMEQSLK